MEGIEVGDAEYEKMEAGGIDAGGIEGGIEAGGIDAVRMEAGGMEAGGIEGAEVEGTEVGAHREVECMEALGYSKIDLKGPGRDCGGGWRWEDAREEVLSGKSGAGEE